MLMPFRPETNGAPAMSSDTVILAKAGAIARIILNNPARLNAISMAMWERLDTILDDLAADRTVRVVIVSGAGGRAFSAGADISEFAARHADATAIRRNTERDALVSARLETLDQPVIAEIDGFCLGGAVAFALHCDLRICSDDARFGIPPARLGHCYSPAEIARVIGVVGLSHTRELLYTARQFSADEAYQMGLVDRVVAKAELEGFVRNYAETIAGNAPLTIGAIKQISREMTKEPGARDIPMCEDLVARCYASEDYQEGRRAFMEKRRPVFRGK
jgi:enoyl-CoA hydratase/carnithine racemase